MSNGRVFPCYALRIAGWYSSLTGFEEDFTKVHETGSSFLFAGGFPGSCMFGRAEK